jgi:hypothetical protein
MSHQTNTLVIEALVASTEPAEAVAGRAEAFLLGRGFRVSRGRLVRGSFLWTLVAFDPRKWRARASVAPRGEDGFVLRVEVDTTGHPMLLDSERAFWDEEVAAAAAAARGITTTDLATIDARTWSASKRSLKTIFGCSVGCAIVGSLVELTALVLGHELPLGGLWGGAGAVFGAALGVRRLRKVDEDSAR